MIWKLLNFCTVKASEAMSSQKVKQCKQHNTCEKRKNKCKNKCCRFQLVGHGKRGEIRTRTHAGL
jgi:hypothetical protein